ncbi:MAG: transcriptional regulator [Nitrospinae bacterium CG22_combo_CG10-13_8_21_14_all_47_10]|nr:MAG: transcriptional regulator [Nitrospinae bacterium CG22_combo_CG10-13_8_21_14_all_47_10]
MISQTAEYALRAVVCLAQNPDKPYTTAEIARWTKVPEHYLSKVLLALAKHEVVFSKKGLHGGYVLAQDPENLPLLNVINAVDPIKHIKSCPLKLKTHGANLCRLHQRVNESIDMMEDLFRTSTVALILSEPTQSIPLRESITQVRA